MTGSTSNPKVFVSYSWTSPVHEQWVLELAERLSSDGILVILDKWDLKEGQDKHVFMEQLVSDPTVQKVLVICDKGYQTKADDRRGGVGTETQLISKEVYEHTDQEKFIPIIRELNEDGKPCIPHYMASRIYIDLSSDTDFEENYQKLIRNLYGKPLLRRPPLGSVPIYVVEGDQPVQRTSQRVRAIKDAIVNDRKNLSGLIADFLSVFQTSLTQFRLSGGAVQGFDDRVVEAIDKMLPLRDDFIDFVFVLFNYQQTVDLEQLHDFFETLIPFCYRPEEATSWTEVDFDNFRFFNYELMLSFLAILIKLKKFKEAGSFLHSQYFYRNSTGELKHNGIEMFNLYARSLDEYRNNRLALRRVSFTADLIKARVLRADITFDDIREADLISYYICELRGERFGWFPRTSAYGGRGASIELFDRMASQRHFERIKELFAVKSADELKTRVQAYVESTKNSQRRYSGLWEFNIKPLENVIDTSGIGSTQ